jgi:hypothetical protein
MTEEGYQSGVRFTPDLAKVFARFPELFDKHMRKAMEKSVINIQSEVKPLTPVGVSSALRQSINTQVTGTGSTLKGIVGSSIKEIYPSVMEFGRKPGAPGPSGEMLVRWVHIKRLAGVYSVKTHRRIGSTRIKKGQEMSDVDREDLQVAWAIARHIHKYGIEGKHFMKRGFEAAKPKISKNFQTETAALLKDIAHGGT